MFDNSKILHKLKGRFRVQITTRPMDYFIEPGLVDHSSVLSASNYEIFQTIDPKERQSKSSLQELFSLLVPSMPLLISFLVTSVFFVVAVFLIALIIKKRSSNSQVQPGRSRRKRCKSFIAFIMGQFRSCRKLLRRSRVFRVLLISYVLYIFFVQIVLAMNIKTEKIIVDLSDLIHSEQSLRTTKRTCCFPGMWFSGRPV